MAFVRYGCRPISSGQSSLFSLRSAPALLLCFQPQALPSSPWPPLFLHHFCFSRLPCAATSFLLPSPRQWFQLLLLLISRRPWHRSSSSASSGRVAFTFSTFYCWFGRGTFLRTSSGSHWAPIACRRASAPKKPG